VATNASSSRPRKAAVAALVGTTVEWYDFFIYATAAALVFREVFFPPGLNPLVGTIAAFGTTSFGYLGRPIGALIFGHLGDRIGRKRTLVATLLLMGIATFGIGLLPTYQSVGSLAPVLLITLRLTQGIAVGGEWGGAALMSVEHAPAGRRTFFGSFTQLGSSIGALFSAFAFTIAESVGGNLAAGSWRFPFLVSAVLVIVGLLVRLKVEESPEFVRVAADGELSPAPARDVVRTMPRKVLIGLGAMLVATGGYYVTSSFFLAYGTEQAGVPEAVMLNALIVAALVEIVFMPLAGLLGDRWNPQSVVVLGLLGIAVLTVPLFLVTHTGSTVAIFAMSAVIAVCTACNYAPMARVLTELFPARVRYTGTSLSYQGAALTAGALTPIVVPTLLAAAGGSPWLVFGYLAVLCLIAATCVVATRRHSTALAAAPDPSQSTI
jgi:MFS family permease